MPGTRRVYDLEDRLIRFGEMTARLAQGFPRTGAGSHIADQFLRSGLSPAANYGEAQSAESRRDFVHKLKMCLKELRETRVWLKYASRLALAEAGALQEGIGEANQPIAIFVKSIETTRKNDRT